MKKFITWFAVMFLFVCLKRWAIYENTKPVTVQPTRPTPTEVYEPDASNVQTDMTDAELEEIQDEALEYEAGMRGYDDSNPRGE